jgi:adenosine kinase
VPAAPRVVVSASIAYDYIMSFGGSFKDHILPDKAHVISVSFLLDALVQQRGGVGGNIAYTLALLGEPCALVGTVGRDFGEYRDEFERLGIDLTNVVTLEDELTSSSFMNADMVGNQIAAFYPGAGGRSAELDVTVAARAARFGIVGAGAPDAMRKHAAEIVAAGCELIFDPSQQIVILTGEDLQAGIDAADIVVGNDYEFGMMERKTGLSVADIASRVRLAVVTYGDRGSEFFTEGETISIPVATPEQVADPTGGGDAYRAGLIKGLLLGAELPVTGRVAALAATYAIERHGPQEHQFTAEEFVARFDRAFPDHAGALSADDLALQSDMATTAQVLSR